MIARVALDSEALLDFKEEPRRAANAQSGLIEVLNEYGYFELLGVPDQTALFDAISRLDPTLSDLWIQALKDLNTLNRVKEGDGRTTMSALCSAEDLPTDLEGLLDLVVIRESLANLRGIPTETGYAKRDLEPEVSLTDSVRRTSTVQGLRNQRSRGSYAKGEAREKVWSEVLEPAAALSTDATILDRFFLTHLLTNGKGGRDHHDWLLRKLNESMQPGASIRVISELPVVGNAAAGMRALRMDTGKAKQILGDALAPLFGKGNTTELHIVLAPWLPRWKNGPHNRHIRFSCGVALCTSEGLDYLDQPELPSPFTWQAATSAHWLGELRSAEGVILQAERRLELVLPNQPVPGSPPFNEPGAVQMTSPHGHGWGGRSYDDKSEVD